MKALIVYDTQFGNTEQIAKAVAGAIPGETRVVRPSAIDPARLDPFDLLVVGSPTLGGRPTEQVQKFLDGVPLESIKGRRVAAFDTRYSGRFVKVFGFASDRILAALEAKGGVRAGAGGEFIVTGKRGPLKDGELERAVNWAKDLVK